MFEFLARIMQSHYCLLQRMHPNRELYLYPVQRNEDHELQSKSARQIAPQSLYEIRECTFSNIMLAGCASPHWVHIYSRHFTCARRASLEHTHICDTWPDTKTAAILSICIRSFVFACSTNTSREINAMRRDVSN